MAVSAKSRSRLVFVEEPPIADDGMNDNHPGIYPGHELSDLRDVPRQPAAEASIHYARSALIGSFPQDPQSASRGDAAAPPIDAEADRQASSTKSRKWGVAVACVSSLIFHAVLFTALAIGFVVVPPAPVEEAGEVVSVIILGDSEADEAAAGEKVDEPQLEEIVAENVQPQTVQPTEVKPSEVPPVETQAVAPQQEVTRVSPENVIAAEPEVLTSQSSAETAVVQPMATELPAEIPPVAQSTPEEVKPVQPAETAAVAPEPDAAPKPEPKPKAEKLVKKPVEKNEQPKRAKPAAGSQGENKQDLRRGSADGSEVAESDQDSRSAGSKGGAGSAAVANYPGKVQSRIRRAVRVPSEFKRMSASMNVRVRLTIGSNGALSGLSVARSSGIPELDQAVVDGVRRAAPFPPLPAEWGKPVWSFTQEVQLTGDSKI